MRKKKRLVTGFTAVLLFLLVFAIFMGMNFRTVVVDGLSMFPTLQDRQRVLVCKADWLVGALKKGDIVVIKSDGPTGYIIKRISRMGGELVDSWNSPESWPVENGPYKVPEGEVFVLGDNYAHSEDSRKFGPVPVTQILGKVIMRR